ncbi:hypothetical protein L9F63_002183 [Diploptera punctata]|uniref:Uncharacterized protein n=1 Tax=Diploptera punctata TaxID=6984 RepID=A0AAD8EHY8_DIPPU|nr:hypothetical protein L9F63_002183 [Diploptera punctata]
MRQTYFLGEGGKEHGLISRPPSAMAMTGGHEEQEEEDVIEVKPISECKPDKQPSKELGKCHIPDSIWSQTCPAVIPENEYYKIVESKVDPSKVEEAIRHQLTPTRNPECGDDEEDEGTLMIECKACNAQLKHNSCGVQLSCYDCQRGKSDKTCHYVIKDKSKYVVSATFLEMEGFEIPDDSKVAEISANLNTTYIKEKKPRNKAKKVVENPTEQ